MLSTVTRVILSTYLFLHSFPPPSLHLFLSPSAFRKPSQSATLLTCTCIFYKRRREEMRDRKSETRARHNGEKLPVTRTRHFAFETALLCHCAVFSILNTHLLCVCFTATCSRLFSIPPLDFADEAVARAGQDRARREGAHSRTYVEYHGQHFKSYLPGAPLQTVGIRRLLDHLKSIQSVMLA